MREALRRRAQVVAASAILAGTGILLSTKPAIAADEPQPDRAPQFIYERVCGYCHGHNIAPIIRGRNLPPETIEYFVRHGQGAMPAFKPTEVTPSELAALAKWISASKADPKEHGQ